MKTSITACKNCKYYVEHYIILPSMQLSPVGGHCKYSLHKKKPIEATDSCIHWECKENLTSIAQKPLTALLLDTENRLKQIQLILSLINN
ncbi:MAG: hypothetical protein K2N14_01515 [Clostridia bacterium]|nr:hypothetical protein [Clostridia bacterium]